MPLYEYECKKCHHRFERIRKFSDPPIKKCPECGGPIEQLISASSVQFKGSGWYVTDYTNKSGTRASSSSDSGGDKGDKGGKPEKSEKKEESKAKSEPKKSTDRKK
jgi:putative FmdB family regulatory protein